MAATQQVTPPAEDIPILEERAPQRKGQGAIPILEERPPQQIDEAELAFGGPRRGGMNPLLAGLARGGPPPQPTALEMGMEPQTTADRIGYGSLKALYDLAVRMPANIVRQRMPLLPGKAKEALDFVGQEPAVDPTPEGHTLEALARLMGGAGGLVAGFPATTTGAITGLGGKFAGRVAAKAGAKKAGQAVAHVGGAIPSYVGQEMLGREELPGAKEAALELAASPAMFPLHVGAAAIGAPREVIAGLKDADVERMMAAEPQVHMAAIGGAMARGALPRRAKAKPTIAEKPIPELEVRRATEKGQVQEGGVPEHPRVGRIRPPAGPGRRYRPERVTQRRPEEGKAPAQVPKEEVAAKPAVPPKIEQAREPILLRQEDVPKTGEAPGGKASPRAWLRAWMGAVPEFRANPEFKVVDTEGGGDIELFFSGGGRFRVNPELLGLKKEGMFAGQKVRVDVESFGLKFPKKLKATTLYEPAEQATPVAPAEARPGEVARGILAEHVVGTEGKPVRPKMIARFLTRELKVPIRARWGNFAQRMAKGFYRPWAEVIRNAQANDMLTTTHELGHHIDKRFIRKGRKGHAYRTLVPTPAWQELVAAGKALYGKRKPAGGYASEGVAEYTRWRLLTDEAATQMPHFHEHFEALLKNQPHLARTLAKATQMSKQWMQQGAESRFEGQIIRGRPKHETFGELATKVYGKLRTWIEDPGYAVKRASKAAVKAKGEELRPSQDPYQLYTFMQLTPEAKAMAWLTDAQFNPRTGQIVGPPLQEVLRPLVKQGRYKEWDRYMVARRALRAYARGQKPGFLKEDAQYIVDKYKDDPTFQEASKAYEKFHDNVLEYAIRSGALPKDIAAKMRKAWGDTYTPFVRVFPEQAKGLRTSRGGGGIVRTGAAVSRFQPGGEEILGAVEGSVHKLLRVIAVSDKMRVAHALRKLKDIEGMAKFIEKVDLPPEQVRLDLQRIFEELNRVGILEQIPEGGLEIPEGMAPFVTFYFGAKDYRGRENIVPLHTKGGKIEFYEVEPELFKALNNMDNQHLPRMLQETIGRATRLRRLGITGIEAGFQLTNIFKDAIAFGIYGSGPLVTAPARLARGAWRTVIGHEAAQRYRRLGGEMSTFHGIDRQNLRASAERALASTKTRKALHIARHPVEFIREVLSTFELMPRVTEFTHVLKAARKREGWTEEDATIHAFNAASDVTVNFRRLGTVMRPINQMFAYANPAVQGIRTFVAKTGAHPARTLSRGAALASMGLAYWWHVKDKEWWRNQPDWLKWGFWSIKMGDDVMRLPVPHELGHLFYSIPIAAVDSAYRKDPKSVKQAVKILLEADLPPGVPTSFDSDGVVGSLADLSIVGPIVEVAINKKGFTGAPIVPRSREDLPPELQYQPYTTKTAKKVGARLGWSPAKIEHAAQAVTGGLVPDIVRTAEQGLGKTAADRPVIGRFFVRQPWVNKQAREEYYDRWRELEGRRQGEKKRAPDDPHVGLNETEAQEYLRLKAYKTVIDHWQKEKRALDTDDSERKKIDAKIDAYIQKALKRTTKSKRAG